MDIPFGAAGLYWLKQYLPLVLHHRLPQSPLRPGGHQRRLRQNREDAGALHHLAGIRRSAVVRVGIPAGTGNRPAHRAVTPDPVIVREWRQLTG